MVSKLRSREVKDNFVCMDSPSMVNYISLGFNFAVRWIKKIIYYLFNKVKSQGFLAALIGSLTDDNAWIIDSGTSRHMTGESRKLHTLSKESSSHVVELGDNKNYAVRGLGSTSLQLDNGSKLHLHNIRYVLGLKKNLLSIYFLEDKGERISFVDGKVLVLGMNASIDKARVSGVSEGSLYQVITPSPQDQVHMEISLVELWHRRYGHLYYRVIPTLSQLVHGIPNMKLDHEGVCKGYSLGNHTRKPFDHSESRSKEILYLIHFDVCGPMSEKKLGGHLYYVTSIDDHSRKT